MKHTQGPWATDTFNIYAPSGEMVARLHDWQGDMERGANARLIAMAPRMLAAIRASADALTPPRNSEEAETLSELHAIIAACGPNVQSEPRSQQKNS